MNNGGFHGAFHFYPSREFSRSNYIPYVFNETPSNNPSAPVDHVSECDELQSNSSDTDNGEKSIEHENLTSSVNSDTQPNEYHCVNIQGLEPEKLMIVPVTINGFRTSALIDTGASNNLLTNSVAEQANLEINGESSINIVGLGSKVHMTVGETEAPISISDTEVSISKFQVTGDSNLSVPVILGKQFCEENKLVINLRKRILAEVNKDESKTYIFMNENNKVKRILHEGIKVRVKHKVKFDDSTVEVPVYFAGCSMVLPESEMYYDGQCKNKKLEGVEGILAADSKDAKVLVKCKPGENAKGMCLKKDSIVGTVNTILEVEVDDDEEDAWTMEGLKNKVKVDNVTEEQKKYIYDMLYRARKSLGRNE